MAACFVASALLQCPERFPQNCAIRHQHGAFSCAKRGPCRPRDAKAPVSCTSLIPRDGMELAFEPHPSARRASYRRV